MTRTDGFYDLDHKKDAPAACGGVRTKEGEKMTVEKKEDGRSGRHGGKGPSGERLS
jgi:hypothetical protein